EQVRYHAAAAMRPVLGSRDLRAGALRHDVSADWRSYQSAARKYKAAGVSKKQGAASSVHRLILVAAEESGQMFDDEPVELGRDADDHATEDLDRLNIVRIDRSPTSGASSEEDVFILPLSEESHCDALFWRRHGRGVGEIAADRHLTLRRGP